MKEKKGQNVIQYLHLTYLQQTVGPRPKNAVFVTFLTGFCYLYFSNPGQPLRGFLVLLLHLRLHLDPEGDTAQELIPLVVVTEVRALHLALNRQFLVVVLFGEQQLHGHQGLNVGLLREERDSLSLK